MNPVRFIYREVAGAWRSLQYDLRTRRAARSASPPPAAPADRTRSSRPSRPAQPSRREVEDWSAEREAALRAPNAVAPSPPAGFRTRQRVTLAAAGLVLLTLAAGGVIAMISGMRALLDPGAPPAGLPAHAAPLPSPRDSSPAAGLTTPGATATKQVPAGASPRSAPGASRTPKPPVPTPAPVPSCNCTRPPSPNTSTTPTGTPTPTGNPTPSPTDVITPTPDATPTDGTP